MNEAIANILDFVVQEPTSRADIREMIGRLSGDDLDALINLLEMVKNDARSEKVIRWFQRNEIH